MMQNEKDALMQYIEFSLVHLVKKYETRICSSQVPELYRDAHDILIDINDTTQIVVDDTLNSPSDTQR